MTSTLSEESLQEITGSLKTSLAAFAARYPGESGRRQPVHTVYGGAHLFKSDTAPRLGSLALRAFETYAPDAATFAQALDLPAKLADTIYGRVREKLAREPVEDFRIDFEDGYGARPDDEEDGHAESAAREVAKGLEAGTLPPFIGIRIKTFSEELHARSIRTLDLFLTTLVESTGGRLPENFVVTLPKIVLPEQVTALIDIFDLLESRLNLPENSLKMEMMVETTQSIINERGEANLPRLLAAARGRCTAAHFGTYDYTASCSITAAYQDMLHPACDFARHVMQVSFGGTGIWLSDGATNIMPVAPHRGELTAEQEAENRAVVHRAWRLHYEHTRHSLANAFYQGWDLHPAQLPTRYAAVYTFFLEGLDAASERLRNFVAKAAQATLVGDVFDDAATGQGLLNYFLRAVNCRALTEREAQDLTSLSLEELRSGSFVKILQNRQK
ncbi:MAG: phosphoenolpyruvate kinase [Acidobacteriota bacterium]|nr:phosphoenolpyruvate kinase [Acidobacteriota bacterium]